MNVSLCTDAKGELAQRKEDLLTVVTGIMTANVLDLKKSRVYMVKRDRILTLKEWLAKFGQETCDGCLYFIAPRCKCTYKKGYCVRYDKYKAEKRSV